MNQLLPLLMADLLPFMHRLADNVEVRLNGLVEFLDYMTRNLLTLLTFLQVL